MSYRIKLIIAVVLALVVATGALPHAAAAKTTALPSGVLIGDSNGIKVATDGAYYIDAEDLHAGDVITKQVTIENTEPYSYHITLMASPLTETGPLHLLDEVDCNLKLDGVVIYDGRVRGNDGVDMTKHALDLGLFATGQQRRLDITLTVHPDMKTYYWTASEALFRWDFYASRQQESAPLPRTGDYLRSGLYVICALLIALNLTTMLALTRRKRIGGGS